MRFLGSTNVSKIFHAVVDEPPDAEAGAGDADQRRRQQRQEQEAEPGEIQRHLVAAVRADQVEGLGYVGYFFWGGGG